MTGLEIIIFIVIFLFSVVFHELAHGYTALSLGDDTAKRAGRLTVNPIKHLDPIGSILLPGVLILIGSPFVFGWAKPVPINPYNFQDKKYGNAKVAVAGSIANFSLAILFGLALRFFPILYSIQGIGYVFLFIVQINLILGIFNLLPIPPLDGSHILFTFIKNREAKIFLMRYGILVLFLVIYFFRPYLSMAVSWLTGTIVGF